LNILRGNTKPSTTAPKVIALGQNKKILLEFDKPAEQKAMPVSAAIEGLTSLSRRSVN
jgi:hypothetical protein